MKTSDKQINWFNNLPFVVRQNERDKYERTCPCGNTVWYEHANSQSVLSWIEIHYGHTAESVKVKTPFVYDWSIPWKFSFAGLIALIEEFKLKEVVSENGQLVYFDRGNNKFVFHRIEKYPDANRPDENHYVTFDVEGSLVSQ